MFTLCENEFETVFVFETDKEYRIYANTSKTFSQYDTNGFHQFARIVSV